MGHDDIMSQSQKRNQSHSTVFQLVSGLVLIPIGIFIGLRALESDDTSLVIIGALVVASGVTNATYAYLRRLRETR